MRSGGGCFKIVIITGRGRRCLLFVNIFFLPSIRCYATCWNSLWNAHQISMMWKKWKKSENHFNFFMSQFFFIFFYFLSEKKSSEKKRRKRIFLFCKNIRTYKQTNNKYSCLPPQTPLYPYLQLKPIFKFSKIWKRMS